MCMTVEVRKENYYIKVKLRANSELNLELN
jgi:hypothetical protein